jgi:hypothetical protein
VVGSEDFRGWVQSWVAAANRDDHPEIPEARRVGNVISLETIGDAVCTAFAVAESGLRQVSPGPGRDCAKARAAFVYLARLEGRYKLDAIAAWLGYRRYGSAAAALHRLRRDLDGDNILRQRLEVARRMMLEEKT